LAENISAEELARILALDGTEVKVGGETLTIKPFRLRQIIEVAKFVDELRDKGVVVIEIGGDKTDQKFDFTKMLLRGGDSMISILSIASGKDSAWIGNLDPLEAIKFCSKVWSVNVDFFDQNKTALMEACGPVLAIIENLIANWLVRNLAGLGQTPSSNSSAADIASKTSRSTRSRRSTNLRG
jgi:hypothetical protein